MNYYFGKRDGKFRSDSENPKYGTAFYLVAVQLENINREFTDWIPTSKIAVQNFTKDRLLPIGKNSKEWDSIKKEISDSYCTVLNSLLTNIIPYKEVVALKIRYLGEKKATHVFHYYPPVK